MLSWIKQRLSKRSPAIQQAVACTIENLEPRKLMSADSQQSQVYHGVYCTCCLPKSLPVDYDAKPVAGPQQQFSLATIPALNSNESADAQIYLDFDGAAAMTWGSFNATTTPAYDTDNNTAAFSNSELENIQQIWARVSEMYSPFNVNVTTVDPGNLNNQETVRIIIGGNGSWYGSAGGVAYLGAFYNSASNVGWVFPKMLANGNPKYTAEATAHEASHTFGLQHQSKYSGSTKSAEYNPGTSAKAPIMGNSYSATRATWWNGQSAVSSSTIQDDVSVLANSSNGFGYRTDDHGGTTGSASALDLDGGSASGSGIIEKLTDLDYFSFTTLSGEITLSVAPAQYAGMLDAKITLVNSGGTTVASSDTSALGETINASVSAGTYYLIVASEGNAGDLGQYNITGSVIASADYVARPTGLTATASGGEVDLSWIDHADNETGFTIERSSNGGSSYTSIGTASANATTYTDSTATIGTSYKYRIKATGSAEDSAYSTVVSVNLLADTPTGLTATSTSNIQIDLEWNDVEGETGYRIDRSINGTTWTQLTEPEADEESFSDTGLTANTKYYYRIVAVTGIGNSAASTTAFATTKPPQPTLLVGTPTTAAIALSWKDVAGETGYRIDRSLDNSSWSQLATTAANVVKYTNTGLSSTTTYYYRVKAVGPGGDSVASDTLTKATMPTAPSDVYVYAASPTSLKLSWADLLGESGYRVEKLAGTTWSQIGSDLAANKVATTITGLTEGTSYSFRVTAINGSGTSTPSATAKGTTLPVAPASLVATATTARSVTLTWTNVATEAGYRIERSPNGSTGWKWIGTTAADVATFTDARLTPGTQYYYRVRAFSEDGVGSVSSTSNATTPASSLPVASSTAIAASKPSASVAATFTAALRTGGYVPLKWNAVKGSTGYRIERSTAKSGWITVATVGKQAVSFTDKLSKSGLYTYRIVAI